MMTTQTKQRILDLLAQYQSLAPKDLALHLSISPQALHRQLKTLCAEKKITRIGSPPHVFYIPNIQSKKSDLQSGQTTDLKIDAQTEGFLLDRYMYIDPQGQILPGIAGFKTWAIATGQDKNLPQLIKEYISVRTHWDQFIDNKSSLIDASEKLHTTFKSKALSKVFYLDFYSLPKFGKTTLGSLVLYAKQAQDKKRILKIAEILGPHLSRLLLQEKIQAVVWVPHSLPRKVPFLKELKMRLNLGVQQMDFLKAYKGEIPVPQKSLSKLEERIENASGTIFPDRTSIVVVRVLVIDDAVGSGATLQAVAEKIKHMNPKTQVFGLAIVGSLKGFEVLREV
jgi:hypothetical protein